MGIWSNVMLLLGVILCVHVIQGQETISSLRGGLSLSSLQIKPQAITRKRLDERILCSTTTLSFTWMSVSPCRCVVSRLSCDDGLGLGCQSRCTAELLWFAQGWCVLCVDTLVSRSTRCCVVSMWCIWGIWV